MNEALPRSSREEVRNPLLALPAAQKILLLPPEVRNLLGDLFAELETDCLQRADHAWKTSKPPIAAYWKVTATYSGHLRKVVRRGLKGKRKGGALRAWGSERDAPSVQAQDFHHERHASVVRG
jgi:hypothetical protein